MALNTNGLWRISVQNVSGRRQPVTYTNDERARLMRAALPSPKHNMFAWPHCQQPVFDPPDYSEVRHAFNEKYGLVREAD